jgi:hypothetical protein
VPSWFVAPRPRSQVRIVERDVQGAYRSEPQNRWMRRQASSSTALDVA